LIDSFIVRKSLGDVGFQQNDVGPYGISLCILAPDPAFHGGEIIFSAQTVSRVGFLHKSFALAGWFACACGSSEQANVTLVQNRSVMLSSALETINLPRGFSLEIQCPLLAVLQMKVW
jgi:hypothetical protein